jgi:hypothetical protein
MQAPVWTAESIRFAQDPATGAEIEQLTSQPVTSTNIYCEQRYASADGSRIALSRHPFGQPLELWVCDLRSLRLCRIGQGFAVGANSRLNAVYFLPQGEAQARLMRLDLLTLETRELFRFDGELPPAGAISPDEKWYAAGPFPVRDNIFALKRIELATGRTDTLCEIEDMSNPHLQFEPAEGRWLNVQINRGRRKDKTTGRDHLSGPLGATLCAVDIETGKVVPLPAGRPHTPPISGHECWAGLTGQLLFTGGQYNVSASAYVTLQAPPEAEKDMPPAAIFSVRPGDAKARVVAADKLYNHLGASDDGRFFIADDHATGSIYIGNIETGRKARLCDSGTRQGLCQYSHVHAYMTPDNRYVIYNSIVTGVGQVYAARVPDGFLDALMK